MITIIKLKKYIAIINIFHIIILNLVTNKNLIFLILFKKNKIFKKKINFFILFILFSY